MAYTIAFFGTKPYDEASFNEKNKEFGFEIRYFKGHLNKNNVLLTQGVDAVCIFVNDTADAEVISTLAANGVKLLALRCAGYNNVDIDAAVANGITVVRVPAYSPYAVAEYTVALMLSLNRKIPRASGVHATETSLYTASWDSICMEKQQESSVREKSLRYLSTFYAGSA